MSSKCMPDGGELAVRGSFTFVAIDDRIKNP